MRCNNCGWTNNPSGAQRCEKCNAPLTGSIAQGAGQASNQNNYAQPQSNQPLKATIPGGNSGLPYVDAPNVENNPNPVSRSVCTCGYPLAPDTKICPNCRREINGGNSNSNPNKQESAPKPRKGTINPFEDNFFFAGQCVLKPIEAQNDASRAKTYSDSAILNRSNIDPNNNSITSREQAFLECRDGEWYIKDLSEQQTTFVRKNGSVKLEDGDIILMGNRRFIFSK